MTEDKKILNRYDRQIDTFGFDFIVMIVYLI